MSEAVTQIHTIIRATVQNRSFFKNPTQAALMIEENLRPFETVDPRTVDQGGFSRKMNGSRAWTIGDVLALQEITGSTRITEAMLRSGMNDADMDDDALTLLREVSARLKEVEDMVSGTGDEAVQEALLDINEQVNGVLRALRKRAETVDLDARRGRA